MKNEHCRWVRDRLPLLAGGDLGIDDRRGAERHLIGCPDCRGRHQALDGAIRALRAAAATLPVRDDAPSIWPALSRQIRESRHRPARLSWLDRLAGSLRVGPGFWPAMGAVLGLGGILVGVTRLAHHDAAQAAFAAPALPSPVARLDPVGPPAPASSPGRPGVLVSGNPARAGVDRFAAPPSLRVQYDLEYAMPAGPGNRDPQRSY